MKMSTKNSIFISRSLVFPFSRDFIYSLSPSCTSSNGRQGLLINRQYGFLYLFQTNILILSIKQNFCIPLTHRLIFLCFFFTLKFIYLEWNIYLSKPQIDLQNSLLEPLTYHRSALSTSTEPMLRLLNIWLANSKSLICYYMVITTCQVLTGPLLVLSTSLLTRRLLRFFLTW